MRRVHRPVGLESPVAQPVVEVEIRLVVVLVRGDQLPIRKDVRAQHIAQAVEFDELAATGVEEILIGDSAG